MNIERNTFFDFEFFPLYRVAEILIFVFCVKLQPYIIVIVLEYQRTHRNMRKRPKLLKFDLCIKNYFLTRTYMIYFTLRFSGYGDLKQKNQEKNVFTRNMYQQIRYYKENDYALVKFSNGIKNLLKMVHF